MHRQVIDRLLEIVGQSGVLTTPEDLAVYGYDGTFVEARPDIVVLPETTEQVSQILKLASETHTAIMPRGMGSGLAAMRAYSCPRKRMMSDSKRTSSAEPGPWIPCAASR